MPIESLQIFIFSISFTKFTKMVNSFGSKREKKSLKLVLSLFFIFHFSFLAFSQKPVQLSSSEILHNIKKLNVLGSVLYVAAHPDDENTRLLAYMAKDRQYKTGYLAMTRGDGGQNLIGDEQGIDLGLIRTQELLAARRMDGAEQFFSRAFDFGFSKSTEEALSFWDEQKVISDAVWVIRKFRPDVIITRFPEDGRAGHGHHSASAVIAREAFVAAADPKKFPEQFKYGVEPWQAKRIMWNTFSFGSSNTTSENQMKIDVGSYIPLLGKSIGELAGESRSNHKSQGFGSSSNRGQAMEYFIPILGEKATKDPMDGVDCGWNRISNTNEIHALIDEIVKSYDLQNPAASVSKLVAVRKKINALSDIYWREQKTKEIDKIIQMALGLYVEVISAQDYAVQGDTIKLNASVNNRSDVGITLKQISVDGNVVAANMPLKKNQNWMQSMTLAVSEEKVITQPYWLVNEMNKGSFNVNDQLLIGMPENQPAYSMVADFQIEDQVISISVPVQHKHVDPIKGEIYQPFNVIPFVSVSTEPSTLVINKNKEASAEIKTTVFANANINMIAASIKSSKLSSQKVENISIQAGFNKVFSQKILSSQLSSSVEKKPFAFEATQGGIPKMFAQRMTTISYDHIPSLNYFTKNTITVMPVDVKTTGKKIGYVVGAGDKVPLALQQMGFQVVLLKENDLVSGKLDHYDAIVMGIRAYNVHEWLEQKHEALMEYVRNGGNMIVQYNTNSNAGPFRNKIGPKPFTISRNRVTEEDAAVVMLDDKDPLLNFPNKISNEDFKGWIQERGIYFGDAFGTDYKPIWAMHDKGEADMNGSLLVRNEGKGRFIYTGLVFFRELPAGVPGAFRLFANLVSNPNKKINESK
jgi:LmbE family N-acetylglucosaminyl deacetylase